MANNASTPNYSSSDNNEEEEEEEQPSASEDEHTSASDSEHLSDSNSDEKRPQKTLISPPKSASKPPVPDISSSEPEESGSETDSDSPPKRSTVVVDRNIKPISSIPMEREGLNVDSRSVKKVGSKTGVTPAPAGKRPAVAPAASEKEAKRGKGNTAPDDDSKKQLFQRLWSEDDEIVILKGMIDYKAESGESLIADMGAFHEFIKKSLHVDVSRAQLVDKIRRLKKKYVNNASREKNGKDRSFSKSHEQRGYELSKLIWGGGGGGVTEGKKKQKNGNGASTSGGMVRLNGVDDKEVERMEVEKKMDVSRFVRYGGRDESPVLPEEIVKAGMELVEGSKRVELEERWNGLKKQELELYLKKMDLIKEQALLVLEAVNSSGN